MEREDKCRSFRHSSSTLRAEGLARQGGKAPIHRENIEGSEVQHHYGDKGCQLPYLEVSLLSIQNLIRQMLGVAESFTPWVNSCHRSVSWFEVSLTPGLGQAKLAYVGSCTTVKMPMKDGMRDKTLTVQDPRSPQRRAISLDHCGTFKNLQSMHGLFSAHRYVACVNRKVSRKQQDNDVTEWAATQSMPGPAENDSDVETQRQVLQCRQKCHLRLQVQGGGGQHAANPLQKGPPWMHSKGKQPMTKDA